MRAGIDDSSGVSLSQSANGHTVTREGLAEQSRIRPSMQPTACLVLTGALLASGCSRPPPAAPPPLRPVADVKQLMKFIIEPAADEYWDAVGTIEDAKGVVHVAPATEEDAELRCTERSS